VNRDYERRRDLLLLHADSPPPWTPAALGPEYWYDPADQYTTLAVDPAISAWTKRVGTGAGVLGRDAPKQPTRATDGQRVIAFDRTAHQSLAHAVDWTCGTVFVVAKYDDAVFASFDGLITGTVQSNPNSLLQGDGGTANFYRDAWTKHISLYRDGVLTNAAGCGAWHIYEMVSNTAPFINGMTIAQDRTSTSRTWKGPIGDIITYPTDIGVANRGLVRAWLKAKWGTP
jgi:hypothetical protein